MSKGGNGTGTVYKPKYPSKNLPFRAEVWITDLSRPSGKRRISKNFKKKSQAEDWRDETVRKYGNHNNSGICDNDITLAEWLMYWLKTFCLNIKESTRTGYACYINQHIAQNKIGRIRLKNLNVCDLQAFIGYLLTDGNIRDGGGMSPKTVRSLILISCNNYINNMDKINILSFGQITGSDMSIIVFSLLESIFQHRVNDHAVPVVLLADEMQRYDELFETNPFAKILNEGRSNNISAIGSTLEYGGTGRKVSKIFSKANIQVFFQPTIDSSKRVKNDVGESVSAEKIITLDEHKCIVKAEFYNKRTQKSETTILLGDSHSDVKIDIKKKY